MALQRLGYLDDPVVKVIEHASEAKGGQHIIREPALLRGRMLVWEPRHL